MNIGAFVSTSGGVLTAIDRAKDLGVESFMIFGSSPRAWQRRRISAPDAEEFRTQFAEAGFDSLWFHGTYLMNFGTDRPDLLKRSKETLVAELETAELLGAKGVIFHLGSDGGRDRNQAIKQAGNALKEVLAQSSRKPMVILENSAGMGGSIGSEFEELAAILEPIKNDPRVAICLDTQHAFAAGYPVHTPDGLAEVMSLFERTIGLDRLVVIHANDSKVPLAGGRDRHENIGEGEIGLAGFRVMAADTRLASLPWLLEVPGSDGNGPDKPNVERLRSIARIDKK